MDPSLYSVGNVSGIRVVCHRLLNVEASGVSPPDNPFNHFVPLILFQMVVIFFATRFTYFCLRPLSQSLVFAQIIAGILLGPTFLDSIQGFSLVTFPEPSRHIIRTFAEFGLMLHMFMLGVQIDLRSLRHTSRKAVIISCWGFFLPFVLTLATYRYLRKQHPLDDNKTESVLPIVSSMNCVTSFLVVTSLLDNLKILNSELGRLASSAALVSDCIGWFLRFVLTRVELALKQSRLQPVVTIFMTIFFYYVLFFVLRPLVVRMIRRSPDGKALTENQNFTIIVIVMVVGFTGEYLGQHAVFITFLFGMSMPDGPPLGTHLGQRIGTMTGGLVVPLYYVVSGGLRVNIWKITKDVSFHLLVMLAVSYLGKFLGTLLASLYFNLPLLEALLLGLIMCTKGIMEIIFYVIWKDMKLINSQVFSLLVISMLVVTGIVTPIIASLYNPSRRYMAFIRRSILDAHQGWDLRMLVCLHSEDNVSPIMNLLEASHATRSNPLTVYVIQLVELAGRAAAVLASHHKTRRSNSNFSHSERIVNAFNQLERQSRGNVVVQHFTAIAPYASMHDDICTLALDKKTNIVIVPFHKHWGSHGEMEASFPQIRAVNRKILQKAPCSVGILVDRSRIYSHSQKAAAVGTLASSYHVTLIFLGGPDDYEALALAIRIAEHPKVHLTVLLIRSKLENIDYHGEFLRDPNMSSVGKKIKYREEIVTDAEGTIQIMRTIEDTCDLAILGKDQHAKSAVVSGLRTWSECPELGLLGDTLTTSDFHFSVLVVQQQPSDLWELD